MTRTMTSVNVDRSERVCQSRDEGLVEFGRGSGITVSGTPERGAVVTKVRELLAFARAQRYPRDAVIDLIETLP